MDIEVLKAFFGWCTVINGAFLLLAFLFCARAGDWVYRMHSKWFPITREAFTLTINCVRQDGDVRIESMKVVVKRRE